MLPDMGLQKEVERTKPLWNPLDLANQRSIRAGHFLRLPGRRLSLTLWLHAWGDAEELPKASKIAASSEKVEPLSCRSHPSRGRDKVRRWQWPLDRCFSSPMSTKWPKSFSRVVFKFQLCCILTAAGRKRWRLPNSSPIAAGLGTQEAKFQNKLPFHTPVRHKSRHSVICSNRAMQTEVVAIRTCPR